jgi:predicted lipoprotein with Yx(FWY)xxD motif
MTRTGPAGTYLVDGTGKSLYLFIIDTGGKSMCSGPCAQAWPPLTTNGKPTASSGVTASKLTTITRSDGSTQVVYAGHPLYYFVGDKAPGDTTGQDIDQFGAKWYVLAKDGKKIDND